MVAAIASAPWGSDRVIVRSSARGEDGAARNSQAGRYDSVLGVVGSEAVAEAIERVIASFADDGGDDDQIFVQPMLDRVAMAGVAFSRSPSGGPYFVINYDDDRSGLTDRVTAGAGDNPARLSFASNRARMPAYVAGALVTASSASSKPFSPTTYSSGTQSPTRTALSSCKSARLAVDPLMGGQVPDKVEDGGARRSRLWSNCSAARTPICTAAEPVFRRHAGLEPR